MEHGDDGACKRGRPRQFDEAAALDAAVAVFRRLGYEGASLSALTDAMGINRPSLYAAFGNKEQLYRRALDRYAERADPAVRAALAEPTARGAVERLLRSTADGLTAGRNPAGCFLVASALSAGPACESMRQELAARTRPAPALAARFEQAVAAGELPPGTDVADLAAYVATVVQGLSVQVAGGVGRDALHRIIDLALRAWPDPPRRQRHGRG